MVENTLPQNELEWNTVLYLGFAFHPTKHPKVQNHALGMQCIHFSSNHTAPKSINIICISTLLSILLH
ncbi:hypothetical protein KFK09_004565 [Dendrobium nobile]|uniref:Uncharacterized protein n=1 Tax=Dendrobium nobile TaxID=94219 RepID=A0A8T3C350_DENNO|nr:hypothetical protein KFK09_004565 [Dendrobium nobile]